LSTRPLLIGNLHKLVEDRRELAVGELPIEIIEKMSDPRELSVALRANERIPTPETH
jgi:hypothetical protein